jgi:hypothetical protein
MNLGDFEQWLRTANRGSRRTYHSGHLVSDKGPDERTFRTPKQNEVRAVAARAWTAYLANRVYLVQARVKAIVEGESDTFNYVAIKAR